MKLTFRSNVKIDAIFINGIEIVKLKLTLIGSLKNEQQANSSTLISDIKQLSNEYKYVFVYNKQAKASKRICECLLCYWRGEELGKIIVWVVRSFWSVYLNNLSRKSPKWMNQSANRIETDKSIPCIEVERALSYTPRWAHSFRKFKRNGVPGIGLPRFLVISKPMLNIAIPELLSTHGKYTLNSGISYIIIRAIQQSNAFAVAEFKPFDLCGILPSLAIETVGGFKMVSSNDSSRSKW